MQTLQIDGVPVFSAPGPRRTTLTLVFGVGVRDETYATRELTHLVEHLVMGSLPKRNTQCNGTTTVDSTSFHATGRPEAVREFVEGVCAALSDLSLSRADAEIGVLQAEDCSGAGGGLVESLWAARYGLTGPGVAFAGGPGPQFLPDELIRAHAATWFVRGNAALVCHGELPEGLRLDLPERPVPPHRPAVPRPQAAPSWTRSWTPGVGLQLSATGPWDPALRMGADVLRERVQDLARTERGLSYSADVVTHDVDPDRREVTVVVDAREGQEGAVAEILWTRFEELCRTGPGEDELAHAREGLAEHLDSADEDDLVRSDLMDAALAAVTGIAPLTVAEGLAACSRVTAAEVQAALRRVRGTALLQVPEWSGFAGLPGLQRWLLCGLTREPVPGRTIRPPLGRRVLGRVGDRAIVLGDQGIAHRDADGDVHAIGWAQVENVFPLLDDGGLVVVGGNLCTVPVERAVFGQRAVDQVSARLREAVHPQRWSVPRPAAVPAG
ncbi:hypothetical protein ACI79J_06330 [Geodermatophilus sp. SYSU D01062]